MIKKLLGVMFVSFLGIATAFAVPNATPTNKAIVITQDNPIFEIEQPANDKNAQFWNVVYYTDALIVPMESTSGQDVYEQLYILKDGSTAGKVVFKFKAKDDASFSNTPCNAEVRISYVNGKFPVKEYVYNISIQ